MQKKEIRALIFQRRKECTDEQRTKWSHVIAQKVIASEAFAQADTVYAYMDCKGEVVTKEIIDAAWSLGKRVAVPRVIGPEEMRFYYITSYGDIEPGYFGVPEPIMHEETEACSQDALMIVPGVAFDKNRHRCGYGKGFYDRFLAAHPGIRTVAVAFDFQIVEEVPANRFDIFPQSLVTENNLYR
ncbi:MAG: 5-formyltetrahydrofolate cyclo-ligase [Eubacteriales bacterium]|nr:5-formyltetrahydrofolate cyclo-ligase [Eubacteriales bacterium]